MGMIRIYQGKSKPAKKKPGWQQAAAEEAKWLNDMKSMTLFNPNARPKTQAVSQAKAKTLDPVVRGPVIDKDRLQKVGKSLNTMVGGGTKTVARPEILYKDDPEMLARELKARERKFAVAPAYNKGGDILVTDEMMKDITAGKTRRR